MASWRNGFACWRGVIASVAVAGIVAAPTVAADLGGNDRGSYKDDAPYYAPPFNWTGGYAGLQFGYAWSETDARSGPTGLPFDQAYSYDSDGLVGGGHIGFNLQNGALVYGIEADLEFADIGKTGIGSLGDTHSTSLDFIGSVRARAGVAVDRTLFYVTGGYAFGDADVTSESGLLAYGEMLHGYTLGGGLEYAFSNNMTARLEYRYTDLGSADFTGVGLKDETDLSFQAVRAGVSIKF